MSSTNGLFEIWEAAASSPYEPPIAKPSQFAVGFILLLIGFVLSGIFAFSMLSVPSLVVLS